VFVKNSHVDRWWRKIKNATEAGLLGGSAKVSTANPNPSAAGSDIRAICVHTYDVEDERDCERVREALRCA
jgi:hypothetical protein